MLVLTMADCPTTADVVIGHSISQGGWNSGAGFAVPHRAPYVWSLWVLCTTRIHLLDCRVNESGGQRQNVFQRSVFVCSFPNQQWKLQRTGLHVSDQILAVTHFEF